MIASLSTQQSGRLCTAIALVSGRLCSDTKPTSWTRAEGVFVGPREGLVPGQRRHFQVTEQGVIPRQLRHLQFNSWFVYSWCVEGIE
jgi:hypothetical protein